MRATSRFALTVGSVLSSAGVIAALVLPGAALAGLSNPVISSVTPDRVATTGGSPVVLNGTGMLTVTAVAFGGQSAVSWSVNNIGTQINAVVPAHAAGAVTIRLTSPGSYQGYGELVGGLTYVVPAPNTPDAPAAAAGDAQAAVTVATSPGGEAATSHLITAAPGGATCTISAATGSCTVAGLENGTTYRFTDTAINASGSSAPSAPSNAVTPVSGAPTPVTPTAPTSPSESASAGAGLAVVPQGRVPALPRASVSHGPGGAVVTSGIVPAGATSVVQTAIAAGSRSTELLRRRANSRARVSAKCPITDLAGVRTYACRLTLGGGRWSLVTQARDGATVVAQSIRVVTIRRATRLNVTG